MAQDAETARANGGVPVSGLGISPRVDLDRLIASASIPAAAVTGRVVLIDHQAISFRNVRVFEVSRKKLEGIPNHLLAMRLARCTTATPSVWPNASTRLTVMIAISRDNGSTWQDVMGGLFRGGIQANPDEDVGGEATECGIKFFVPGDVDRIRLTADASATINSFLTVETFPWP